MVKFCKLEAGRKTKDELITKLQIQLSELPDKVSVFSEQVDEQD